jgi:hypothetical protein
MSTACITSNVQGIISKKWKDADLELPVGRTSIDTEFVVRIAGSVEKREDQFVSPTVSIPLIATLAFFVDKLGVEKTKALETLRDAITEAMMSDVEESPSIKSRIKEVSEAVAAVKKDLIERLPKMRRAGRVDLDDLLVTVHELQRVESVFSVA